MSGRSVLSTLGYFFLFLQPVAAFGGDVAWKAKDLYFEVQTTHQFTQKFKELLSDEGSGNLQWKVVPVICPNPPDWLGIYINEEKIEGTPKPGDGGSGYFCMSVKDLNSGGGEENIAKFHMTVKETPVWKESPIQLGRHPEGIFFQFDLNDEITYPGPGSLTFTIEDPDGDAPWLKPPSGGILSGTPQKAHIGKYEITVTATSAEGISAIVEAVGEVYEVVCPKWVTNPISLKDGKEDDPYSATVSKYVENPENADLKFSLVTGAPTGWIQMSDDGVLSGTPGANDVGAVSLVAKVSATVLTQSCEDETAIQFNVIHVNHPPKWKEDPIYVEVYETKPFEDR